MTKTEQLKCIDNFVYDNMDKDELRNLVFDLLEDESLLRSFKLFK
jgi:hypothetical protein